MAKNFLPRIGVRVYNPWLNLQHAIDMEALIMPVVAAGQINTVSAGHDETTARNRLAFELYSFGVVLCFKTY